MTFHEFAGIIILQKRNISLPKAKIIVCNQVILQSLLDSQPQDFLPESQIRAIWLDSNVLPHTTFHEDKFLNLGIYISHLYT
jgi:hypothetical protein